MINEGRSVPKVPCDSLSQSWYRDKVGMGQTENPRNKVIRVSLIGTPGESSSLPMSQGCLRCVSTGGSMSGNPGWLVKSLQYFRVLVLS